MIAPRKHPTCDAAMCGLIECKGSGPCYVAAVRDRWEPPRTHAAAQADGVPCEGHLATLAQAAA